MYFCLANKNSTVISNNCKDNKRQLHLSDSILRVPMQMQGVWKRVYSEHELKKHVLTHIREKPFDCQEGGAGFSQYGILKNHIRSHEC